jgi:hypothetical protein
VDGAGVLRVEGGYGWDPLYRLSQKRRDGRYKRYIRRLRNQNKYFLTLIILWLPILAYTTI